MKSVNVVGVTKTYGAMRAVDSVAFEVKEGEFVSLLGPSGCGKTTTLRMIAGLVEPDVGRIEIGGEDVVGLPTYQRNIGMVFQSYALFPHMTVAENIGYGLRMRQMRAQDIAPRVKAALDMIRLPGISDRYPKQLSGGQQQRVALARAIAIEPNVLLLDEPLSNIDLKLRMQMRVELKQLQRKLGITSIFVTHDQGEGLNMSDRVVVMDGGRVAQAGSPKEIYENPANRFVAEFIGESTLVDGEVVQHEGRKAIVRSPGGMELPVVFEAPLTRGQKACVALRPEKLRIGHWDAAQVPEVNCLDGKVVHVAYSGASVKYIVQINASETVAVDTPTEDYRVGDRVVVGWRPEDARLLTT